MTKLQMLLVTSLGALFVALMGCAAFEKSVMPCWIPDECIGYADANVPIIMPWTTINDAEYVKAKMDLVHYKTEADFTFMKEGLQGHIERANQFRHIAFDSTGPLGILLASIPGFAAGSYLISKPGDKRRITKLENGNGNRTNS